MSETWKINLRIRFVKKNAIGSTNPIIDLSQVKEKVRRLDVPGGSRGNEGSLLPMA